jgi:hypothetical protein
MAFAPPVGSDAGLNGKSERELDRPLGGSPSLKVLNRLTDGLVRHPERSVV